MRELSKKLGKAVLLGQVIDARLEARLKSMQQGSDQYAFVAERAAVSAAPALIDLQQQLVVNQQGILATELIIRNNKELMRGVNRALNVTLSALQVGATVALALANQRDVIEKVRIGQQDHQRPDHRHRRAPAHAGCADPQAGGSAQLDIERLKTAFVNIRAAMDDISTLPPERAAGDGAVDRWSSTGCRARPTRPSASWSAATRRGRA